MGKSGISVKVTDRGLRASVRAVFGARNSSVKVGIFGDKGDQDVETADGSPSTISVAELAAIHEFGLGVPERPFLRTYFDSNIGRIQRSLLNLMSTAIQKAISSGRPIEDKDRKRILDRIGLLMQSEIQAKLAKGDLELTPLAQATIDRKGSSTPLIDTGQLRSAITYESSLDGVHDGD
jgi:hypothetical protein